MNFIKISITAVTLSIMVFFSQQTFSQISTGFGVEAGINLANISLTPNQSTSNRTGLMIGGFAEIGVAKNFYIRPGLRYVSKGFSSTVNGVTFTERLSYLEIPALLKMSFPLTEVKPYIMAGPTLGIQLSANEEATDGLQTQSGDVSSAFESTDFGLYFGAGLDFHVASKIDMFAGAGYSLGLSSITKASTVTGKNYGIQLIAGVKFGL